ncbi:MAG: hypothetical protein ACR5KV_06785 [Wolbachia sp.]
MNILIIDIYDALPSTESILSWVLSSTSEERLTEEEMVKVGSHMVGLKQLK